MRFTIGRLITALVLLATTAAAVWALMPRPISVETATVTRGKFVATVDEDGKTRVRERYIVAAPLSGRLSRVRLKVGDQVGVDDVVAMIAPSPAPFLDPRTRREVEERLGTAEATIERTKAAVDRAKAQAEQAKNDLARTRTLVERGATTIQALERAELAMRVADRDLRAAEFANHAAEHDLGQAKALLAQYGDSARTPPEAWNVTAPVAGLVLKVNQESETIVQEAHRSWSSVIRSTLKSS
jgi:HlyD family secretion protein